MSLPAGPRFRRVVFLGSKPPGLACLATLHRLAPQVLTAVITVDDRSDSRSCHGEFVRFGDVTGVPVNTAENKQASEGLIAEARADLVMVLGWYWRIPKTLLDSVPGGFLGIHYSLLPKYRGGSPLVWQIINGEGQVGWSLLSFTEGLDEGPIWDQGAVPLGDDEYISDALRKLEYETIAGLQRTYPRILDGTIAPRPQPHEGATYCKARTPADGEIDWNQPARRIYDFIRAQSHPYPGAFTWCNGERLRVWRAVVGSEQTGGPPGKVSASAATGIQVACGDGGTVWLTSVAEDRPPGEIIPQAAWLGVAASKPQAGA